MNLYDFDKMIATIDNIEKQVKSQSVCILYPERNIVCVGLSTAEWERLLSFMRNTKFDKVKK